MTHMKKGNTNIDTIKGLFNLVDTNNSINENIESNGTIKNTIKSVDTISIDQSRYQVEYFENNSEKIVSLFKNNEFITESSEILQEKLYLENYIIVQDVYYIKIRDKFTNYQYGFFSLGNKKLSKDGNTTYLIWNLLQRTTCQYATEECLNKCYANKAYNRASKNVKSRGKQILLSNCINFIEIFKEVLAYVNTIFNTKVYIRIHESGDFYSKTSFDKNMYILETNTYKNKSLIYTKNIELIPYLAKYNNHEFISIRYSIMIDTNIEIANMVQANDINNFICLPSTEGINNSVVCPGNCSKCFKCWNSKCNTIVVQEH